MVILGTVLAMAGIMVLTQGKFLMGFLMFIIGILLMYRQNWRRK